MLNIIKTSKEVFDSKTETERRTPQTLFLVRNTQTNLCSIYFEGECYGENIDEDSIDDEIVSIKKQLNTFQLATNADILAILNS